MEVDNVEERRRDLREKMNCIGILVDIFNAGNVVNFKTLDISAGGACLCCDKPVAESLYRMSVAVNDLSPRILACPCRPVRSFAYGGSDKETGWGNGAVVVFARRPGQE